MVPEAQEESDPQNLIARFTDEAPQENNVRDTLKGLTANPVSLCRLEMAQVLQMRPDLILAKDEYVRCFNPSRLVLPPPAPPPKAEDHQGWT